MVLILAILMASCHKPNPGWVWYQEAMQDDGSIILVKQIETSLNEARNVPGQQLMGYHRPKLEFADPKTGLPVTWYPLNLPRIFPYALHVHDKVPYLFATFYLTDDYHEFGCPVPPYIVFQWDGGKWELKSDWYTSDKTYIAPLVKEYAEKYAKDKNIKVRAC